MNKIESKFKKGFIPWIKGKKHTNETKKKMSESRKKKKLNINKCIDCKNNFETYNIRTLRCNICKKEIKKKYDLKRRKEKREYLLKQKKEYRKNNPDKIKELNKKHMILGGKERKQYIAKWKATNKNKLKEYNEKDKDKLKSRNMARKNIKIPNGYLCEKCNINLAIERHHKDYSKPLEVELLCVKCHAEETWKNN